MTCVRVACLCVEDVIIQTRHMLHHPIKSLLSETVMHTAGFPVLHLCHGKKMLSKKLRFSLKENDGEFFFTVIYMYKKSELLIEIMIDKTKVNF